MRPGVVSFGLGTGARPCVQARGFRTSGFRFANHVQGNPAASTRPSVFRVSCGKKDDCEQDALRNELKKAQKALKKSLKRVEAEMNKQGMGEMASDAVETAPEAFWSELYTEQKALYQREMTRWDEERKMWADREKLLLSELARLQKLTVDLCAAKGLGAQDIVERMDFSDISETVGSVDPPFEPQPETRASATVEKDPSSVMESKTVTESSDPPIGSIAASLAAAVDAVDKGDVLADDFADLQSSLEKSYLESGNGTDTSSTKEAGAKLGGEAESSESVETVKSPPTGPPPLLQQGDDDIFWVNQLHQGLLAKGYYPGDEDLDDFYFGGSTMDALMTFQCCEGIEETGVVDDATWRVILGDEMKPILKDSGDKVETGTTTEPEPKPKPVLNTAATVPETSDDKGTGNGVKPVAEAGQKLPKADNRLYYERKSPDAKIPRTKTGWPSLTELDGGIEVHWLHTALNKKGYFCGDDDMKWWYYGDDTVSALKVFQCCSGLPESGVCDERTWKALVGEDFDPKDLETLCGSDDSYDEDMGAGKGVWLIGEERWERR